MTKSVRSIFKYRRNIPTREMTRGLRIISNRTGWPVYTSESYASRGGYTPREVPPRFLPKENTVEQ